MEKLIINIINNKDLEIEKSSMLNKGDKQLMIIILRLIYKSPTYIVYIKSKKYNILFKILINSPEKSNKMKVNIDKKIKKEYIFSNKIIIYKIENIVKII